MADEGAETTIDVTVEDDRTVVTVTGTRDAAVIVSSASGERIYLPPEDFADEPEGEADTGPSVASPYDGTTSAYGVDAYGGSPDPHGPDTDTRALGVTSTPTGFRIVHPEPVHDVRVVGARD